MRPPARADRWRILGGMAVAVVVLYLVLVHWWFTAPMLAMGGQIRELRDEEQALRAEIAQRPQLQARLAQVRQFEAANPGFLPEATRELASAGLVQRLRPETIAAGEIVDLEGNVLGTHRGVVHFTVGQRRGI